MPKCSSPTKDNPAKAQPQPAPQSLTPARHLPTTVQPPARELLLQIRSPSISLPGRRGPDNLFGKALHHWRIDLQKPPAWLSPTADGRLAAIATATPRPQ